MEKKKEARVHAFVCEINKESVKMFDWKQQLMEVPNADFEDEVELGKFYELIEGKYQDCGEDIGGQEETDLNVFVKDGEVYAKVLAFAPNEAVLELAGLSEYRNTAYSYLLQLLQDPDDLFFEFPQSEVGLATVKYAPTHNSVFKVVDVEEVPEAYKKMFPSLDCLFSQAPWNFIQNEKAEQEALQPSETFPRFSRTEKTIYGMEFIGICFDKKVEKNKQIYEKEGPSDNPMFKDDVAHIFYSPILGPVRALDAVNVKVGDWFSFKVNDSRQKKTHKNGTDHYRALTMNLSASMKIADQLPTRVKERKYKENDVENPVFTTSFLLEPGMLESRDNSKIQNLKRRLFGVTDAYFQSAALGRVDIDWTKGREIIKRVNSHMKKYEEEKEREQLCVEVEVEADKFWWNHREDPNKTFFYVTKVLRISDLIRQDQI